MKREECGGMDGGEVRDAGLNVWEVRDRGQ